MQLPTLRRGLILLLLAWTLVQGLREPWRAMWYHLADPWPAQAPVLWTPSSGHVERLATGLERLPLDGMGTLAVETDPALGDQGWYEYLWLAYLLPQHDLVWTPSGAPVPGADARLVVRGGVPELEVSDP